MKRSIARQAEAERERRARVITTTVNCRRQKNWPKRAEVMAVHPAALRVGLLETVVEVAAEKNSTLVLPFPVELLRFLERATPQASRSRDDAAAMPSAPAAASKSDMSKLDPPQIPDDASGLEVDTHASRGRRIPADETSTDSVPRLTTPRRVETQNSFCSGVRHSYPSGSPRAPHAFVDATEPPSACSRRNSVAIELRSADQLPASIAATLAVASGPQNSWRSTPPAASRSSMRHLRSPEETWA